MDDGSNSDETYGDDLLSSSDDIDMKYYSEQSEDDEWEQQVMSKRKARVKDRRRSNVKILEIKGAKKLGGLKKPTNRPTPPPSRAESSSAGESAKKKRRVIQDSDSE